MLKSSDLHYIKAMKYVDNEEYKKAADELKKAIHCSKNIYKKADYLYQRIRFLYLDGSYKKCHSTIIENIKFLEENTSKEEFDFILNLLAKTKLKNSDELNAVLKENSIHGTFLEDPEDSKMSFYFQSKKAACKFARMEADKNKDRHNYKTALFYYNCISKVCKFNIESAIMKSYCKSKIEEKSFLLRKVLPIALVIGIIASFSIFASLGLGSSEKADYARDVKATGFFS